MTMPDSHSRNREARRETLPVPELLPPKLQQDLTLLEKSELIAIIVDLEHDFQKVNQIYNDRAAGWGWCGNYESYQSAYNHHLRLMSLKGRAHLVGSWLNAAGDTKVGTLPTRL